MAISYNYYGLMFQFPYGFQIGATAVIGNVLGEEKERTGKILSMMTVIYSSTITLLLGLLTYNYASEIAYAYTEDSDTVALLERCLESLSFSLATLGAALSLQAVMKALLQQVIASKILMMCLYFISLPMAWWLSIELEVGVTGLWRGFCLGQVVVVLLYAFLIYHIDWQAII